MRNYKNKAIIIVGIVSFFFLFFGIFTGIKIYESYNSVTYEPNKRKMLSYAERFYNKGEMKKATEQLERYCTMYGDFEQTVKLAEWYSESGEEEKAYTSYQWATQNADYMEDELSVNSPFIDVKSIDNLHIIIEPVIDFTDNMSLITYGENLTPSLDLSGKVYNEAETLIESENYKTTEWFYVDSSKKFITLMGNFNCALWQFKDTEGDIDYYKDVSIFNDLGSTGISKYSYSTAEIPDNALYCRVTFFDFTKEEIYGGIEEILITYGNGPQGYTNQISKIYRIPDLKVGEYIEYKDSQWFLYSNEGTKESLELGEISLYEGGIIQLNGDICGKVRIFGNSEEEILEGDKSKEYGIRFNKERGYVVGERLGDALGFHFDYIIGSEWVFEGKNDFDSAYPWSEMKLCNINYDKNGELLVTYEHENGFATDGSNGNVMVQIPKFYVKRLADKNSEEIWISGTCYDGYVIDPVFKVDGKEKDYVYVSAYVGSYQKGIIRSVSGKYPVVQLTYNNIKEAAQKNGEGFNEINYYMYSAIQKLYLVETGCSDSTSIFTGESALYYFGEQEDTEKGIAIESVSETNTITVNKTGSTQKLAQGTSIILMNVEEEWGTYNFEDNSNLREITNVKYTGDKIKISFSGSPINIKKGYTLVASFPSLTGKTDFIEYCTGVFKANNGHYGFKYRNIENIYGSVLIMLDSDTYFQNGYFFFENVQGEIEQLSFQSPEQSRTLNVSESGFAYGNMNCIKSFFYDEEHPTIMVPSEVGASTYDYYSDYFYLKSISDDKKYYICVGSACDNQRLGGIFQMRGIINSESFKGNFHSGRIMYR